MKNQKLQISNYLTPEEYEDMLRKTESVNELRLRKIDEVFDELRDSEFQIISTTDVFDKAKVFIRGAVTRIGAYSNIGKSKLAYWIVKTMLTNGYKGIIFSTEVSRWNVLAHMVSSFDGEDFWRCIKKTHTPTINAKEKMSDLQIYDGRDGVLFLENIRDYIIANKGDLDFIMVDFCQNIKDYSRSVSEYEQLSNYALEIQQMAQLFDICVIDLSQLANSSIREDYKKTGFIAYKGSGALYASADIGIQLTRDKVNKPDIMHVEVRKHKFFTPGDLHLKCDFSKTDFKYYNARLDDDIDTTSAYNFKMQG